MIQKRYVTINNGLCYNFMKMVEHLINDSKPEVSF